MSLPQLFSLSYSRHPSQESQNSSATNQSHPKTSRGNGEHNRPLTMDQQLTLAMAPMLNLTRYQNNAGKNGHSKRPLTKPRFSPEMSSVMNVTHFKSKHEKSGRIFSFSDADNEISVSIMK